MFLINIYNFTRAYILETSLNSANGHFIYNLQTTMFECSHEIVMEVIMLSHGVRINSLFVSYIIFTNRQTFKSDLDTFVQHSQIVLRFTVFLSVSESLHCFTKLSFCLPWLELLHCFRVLQIPICGMFSIILQMAHMPYLGIFEQITIETILRRITRLICAKPNSCL